jgi:hypothetical protein
MLEMMETIELVEYPWRIYSIWITGLVCCLTDSYADDRHHPIGKAGRFRQLTGGEMGVV